MNFLVKNGVDIATSVIITEIFSMEFWLELIVAVVIVILNAFIFPLIKKASKKLGADEEKVQETIDKLEDAIENIDKKDEK